MFFEKSFVDYQSIWLDHDKNCARLTGGLCIGRKLFFQIYTRKWTSESLSFVIICQLDDWKTN